MPVRAKLSWSRLVRLVVGRCGTMPMHTHLIVRFGYGGWAPWVTRNENGDLLAIAGPGMLLLRTPAELVGANLTTVGDFVVSAGQRVPFVLTYFPAHLPLPDPVEADNALLSTEDSWTSQASACRSSQQRGESVTRSLITLKALTYAPTGGFIAASTSSLPEQLGGPRNWDYRFCWLRDVTLTLLALTNTRIYDEARAWRDWLLRAAAGSPTNIQIMYGAAGERLLAKCEVSWLRGYENSKPVRVGNVAVDQLQLDVLGEVMDALHQGRAGELQNLAAAWNFQFAALAHLETAWRAPDEGIWEVRSGRQHYSHSKVMAWVAFDRGIKAVEAVGLDGQTD
jgi:GH15 family glucan-1,4-alpha-glucosidase